MPQFVYSVSFLPSTHCRSIFLSLHAFSHWCLHNDIFCCVWFAVCVFLIPSFFSLLVLISHSIRIESDALLCFTQCKKKQSVCALSQANSENDKNRNNYHVLLLVVFFFICRTHSNSTFTITGIFLTMVFFLLLPPTIDSCWHSIVVVVVNMSHLCMNEIDLHWDTCCHLLHCRCSYAPE